MERHLIHRSWRRLTRRGFCPKTERREQIEEVKSNQKEYEKWSKKIKRSWPRCKGYTRMGLRSGIPFWVDNPTNSLIQFLYEENQKYLAKLKASVKRLKIGKERGIEKGWVTGSLEFFNREFLIRMMLNPLNMARWEKNVRRKGPKCSYWNVERLQRIVFSEVDEKVFERERTSLTEMGHKRKEMDIITVDNFERAVERG